MTMKGISKTSSCTLWDCLMLLGFFLLGGSAIVSVVGLKVVYLVDAIAVLVFVFKVKSISKRNLRTLLVVGGFLLADFFYWHILDEKPSEGAYITCALIVVFVFMMTTMMTISAFEHAFIVVLTAIAASSLVIYIAAILFGIDRFAIYGNEIHQFILLHSFCGFKDFRNSSIFWEPGIFQIYLNVGLFFLLFQNVYRAQKKLYYVALLLFVVSILTTKSTTGYIVLVGIVCYWLLVKWKNKSIGFKVLMLVPMVAIILIILYFAWNSYAIQYKFFSVNQSLPKRLAALTSTPGILRDNPILGVGIGTRLSYDRYADFGVQDNSNGIANVFVQLGIIYGIAYLNQLVSKSKYYFANRKFLFLGLIIVCLMTEPLTYYSIGVLFWFTFKRQNALIGRTVK
ncbi:O-antigen ligase family protein [Owariibacterium komagatae]|uniref:O-antigen ligase family protein n=1 Tax=Owariibacterium komagatae TaxID=3136601 RepID=UPI0038B2303E